MKSHIYKNITFIFLITVFLLPHATHAANADLEVAGWIPYWRDSEGMKDARRHIDQIDVVYPFAYTVTTQGSLRDQAGLGEKDWKNFIRFAKRKDVEVIPTVMWSDGASIHSVLSNEKLRSAHIEEIVRMVENGDYDGVGIDYEAKKAETKDSFSLFLKELKAELGDKVLTCAIEARTPPDSLYKEVPAVITYANDYKEIGKHCDRIEIMAYDQQRADIKLNKEKNGLPYMPIADTDWVRKVVELALKDFPDDKVLLGIPTYGNHYAVTVAPEWFRDYSRIGALNPPDILDIAKQYRVTPTRNKAGELGFSYLPKSSNVKLKSSLDIPKGTKKGDIVAARALAYANKTGKEVTFNIASYQDAEAMKEKIDLAKEFNLRGVAFFKFDGEEDRNLWKYLEE